MKKISVARLFLAYLAAEENVGSLIKPKENKGPSSKEALTDAQTTRAILVNVLSKCEIEVELPKYATSAIVPLLKPLRRFENTTKQKSLSL